MIQACITATTDHSQLNSGPTMRVLCVDPVTSRCLVSEGSDENPDDPARMWLVTRHWRRTVAPAQDGPLVLSRRGWIGDLYIRVPSFERALSVAHDIATGYHERVARRPSYARDDDTGPFRMGLSVRRSADAFRARQAKQRRILKMHIALNRAHSALFLATAKCPYSDAVRAAITAAGYRIEGRVPPPPMPPISEEDRERVLAVFGRRRKK